MDYDYLDKLSDKELEWLNNFTEEYVHANLTHKGKKLHKTKKLRLDCYNRNNARNRCIWTRAKAAGKTVDLDPKFREGGLDVDEVEGNEDAHLISKARKMRKKNRTDW